MNAPATRADRCLAPIPAPGGGDDDPRYDPRHVALRTEIEKLDSPAGGAVDWRSVESLAVEVLTTVAKDLLAAAALAVAAFRVGGVDGLVDGLDAVRGLLESFGEALHPRRPRARANALAWLVQQVGVASDEHVSAAGEEAHVASARQALDRVEAAGRLLLAADLPDFAPARDALARLGERSGSSVALAAREQVEPTAPSSAPPASVEPAPTPVAPAAQAEAPAMQRDARALAADYLAPISEAAPAGADARYDAGYEWVRREVERLDSASTTPIDWARIEAECDRLLRTTTKDLALACYLPVARLETAGLDAMARALAVPAAMLVAFGPAMQPPADRPRRRANLLTWLFEQLAARLGRRTFEPGDRAAVDLLDRVAKELASAVRDSFDADGPAVRVLLEAVERASLSVPAPELPKPAEPAAPAAFAPVTAAPSRPAPAAPSPAPAPVALPEAALAAPPQADGVPSYLSSVGQGLEKAARLLRAGAPDDPRGYRLLRVGLYLAIEAPPPHGADGKTSVPPLPAPLLARLSAMESHGKWVELLDETESALGQARFALDLHRHSARALAALGRDAAKRALIGEVRRLLERLPMLPDLAFANGAPLADEATRRFFADEVLATGSARAPRVDAVAETDDGAGARAELDEAIRAGRFEDALGRLESRTAESASGEQRFRYRLTAARAFADRGERAIALALHGALDDEVRRHALEDWAPSLVAEHLEAYLAAARAEGATAGVDTAPLAARLARIAPSRLRRWT